MSEKESKRYRVLVNGEAQYSLWAADKKFRNEWKSIEPIGSTVVCFSYTEEVWTDMRP